MNQNDYFVYYNQAVRSSLSFYRPLLMCPEVTNKIKKTKLNIGINKYEQILVLKLFGLNLEQIHYWLSRALCRFQVTQKMLLSGDSPLYRSDSGPCSRRFLCHHVGNWNCCLWGNRSPQCSPLVFQSSHACCITANWLTACQESEGGVPLWTNQTNVCVCWGKKMLCSVRCLILSRDKCVSWSIWWLITHLVEPEVSSDSQHSTLRLPTAQLSWELLSDQHSCCWSLTTAIRFGKWKPLG